MTWATLLVIVSSIVWIFHTFSHCFTPSEELASSWHRVSSELKWQQVFVALAMQNEIPDWQTWFAFASRPDAKDEPDADTGGGLPKRVKQGRPATFGQPKGSQTVLKAAKRKAQDTKVKVKQEPALQNKEGLEIDGASESSEDSSALCAVFLFFYRFLSQDKIFVCLSCWSIMASTCTPAGWQTWKDHSESAQQSRQEDTEDWRCEGCCLPCVLEIHWAWVGQFQERTL